MSGARRSIDKVTTDAALELVCTLAYERAVAGGDEAVISAVENAILKLRELKVEATGEFKALTIVNQQSDAAAFAHALSLGV